VVAHFATTMGVILIMAAVLLPAALFLYIAGFMFIHGTSPKGSKHDQWINKICAPEGIFNTVMTWGYLKASWSRFFNFYRLMLFPQPFAAVGKVAVDAKLVDLNGKVVSLLHDYIGKMPKGKPLILNMGSYT
jgi:hypothetical protein